MHCLAAVRNRAVSVAAGRVHPTEVTSPGGLGAKSRTRASATAAARATRIRFPAADDAKPLSACWRSLGPYLGHIRCKIPSQFRCGDTHHHDTVPFRQPLLNGWSLRKYLPLPSPFCLRGVGVTCRGDVGTSVLTTGSARVLILCLIDIAACGKLSLRYSCLC